MQVYRLYSTLLSAAVAALTFAGCYTQVASDKGDLYGYNARPHHEVIVERTQVRSDTTVILHQAPQQAVATKTVLNNDTVYVDDTHPMQTESSTTIVNNYYGGYASPWDGYYAPRHDVGVAIVIGTPYPWPVYGHRYGYSSWYDPYDYWGHGYWRGPGLYAYDPYYDYPPSPFYGCIAPVYYDPYYGYGGYGYGYGRWAGYGYYGDRGYYGDDDDRGYYGNGQSNGGAKTGRIRGGERRSASTGPQVGKSGNASTTGVASVATARVPSSTGVTSAAGNRSGAVSLANVSTANTQIPTASASGRAGSQPWATADASVSNASPTEAATVSVRSGDRNAPVHLSSPAGDIVGGEAQTSTTSVRATPITPTETAVVSRGTVVGNYTAPNGHHVVVMRRAPSDQGTGYQSAGRVYQNAGGGYQSSSTNRAGNTGTVRASAQPESAAPTVIRKHTASSETSSEPVYREPVRSSGDESTTSGRSSGGETRSSGSSSGSGNSSSSGGGERSSGHSGGGRAK